MECGHADSVAKEIRRRGARPPSGVVLRAPAENVGGNLGWMEPRSRGGYRIFVPPAGQRGRSPGHARRVWSPQASPALRVAFGRKQLRPLAGLEISKNMRSDGLVMECGHADSVAKEIRRRGARPPSGVVLRAPADNVGGNLGWMEPRSRGDTISSVPPAGQRWRSPGHARRVWSPQASPALRVAFGRKQLRPLARLEISKNMRSDGLVMECGHADSVAKEIRRRGARPPSGVVLRAPAENVGGNLGWMEPRSRGGYHIFIPPAGQRGRSPGHARRVWSPQASPALRVAFGRKQLRPFAGLEISKDMRSDGLAMECGHADSVAKEIRGRGARPPSGVVLRAPAENAGGNLGWMEPRSRGDTISSYHPPGSDGAARDTRGACGPRRLRRR